MSKKLIQRYLPSHQKIQQNRYLKFLGSTLYQQNLWHLNRRSISKAFFIGVFSAFVPMPFQMVLSAFLAVMIRCNLPISVALVWITNPLTMPVIFYFTYVVGCYILNVPIAVSNFNLSLSGIGDSLIGVGKPLFVGSIATGFVLATISYFAIRIYWRWHVVSKWKKRNQLNA